MLFKSHKLEINQSTNQSVACVTGYFAQLKGKLVDPSRGSIKPQWPWNLKQSWTLESGHLLWPGHNAFVMDRACFHTICCQPNVMDTTAEIPRDTWVAAEQMTVGKREHTAREHWPGLERTMLGTKQLMLPGTCLPAHIDLQLFHVAARRYLE